MEKVEVTVDFRGKKTPLDKVTDTRIRGALAKMAETVALTLSQTRCPEHKQTPTKIRLHMGSTGNADLQYESCCEKLRDVVSKAL